MQLRTLTKTPITLPIAPLDHPDPNTWAIARKLLNFLPPAPRHWYVEPNPDYPERFSIRVNNRLLPATFPSIDKAERTIDHLWTLS